MTIVSCPRSNQHVGVGAPPLEAFYAKDVNVAFGTDSLASSPDLNLFFADGRQAQDQLTLSQVPEPASLAMFGLAMLGTAQVVRRRKRGAFRDVAGMLRSLHYAAATSLYSKSLHLLKTAIGKG